MVVVKFGQSINLGVFRIEFIDNFKPDESGIDRAQKTATTEA